MTASVTHTRTRAGFVREKYTSMERDMARHYPYAPLKGNACTMRHLVKNKMSQLN